MLVNRSDEISQSSEPNDARNRNTSARLDEQPRHGYGLSDLCDDQRLYDAQSQRILSGGGIEELGKVPNSPHNIAWVCSSGECAAEDSESLRYRAVVDPFAPLVAFDQARLP